MWIIFNDWYKKLIMILNIYIFVKTNVLFTFKKQLLRNNE